MGHSRPLFLYFRLFCKQLSVNKCSIKVADDWIQTWVLWYRKRPLCQLRHNHYPYFWEFTVIFFQLENAEFRWITLFLNHRVASSVTRCWSKKVPNFLQKWPKNHPHQFHIKSAVFHNSPKLLLNIWATFTSNFVPKNFQKVPNLVTLVARL